MSVMTTTQSGSMGTQRTGMSSRMSTKASQLSRNVTGHDASRTGLRLSEEPPGLLEMDIREVPLENLLVVDSDQEGLPYGA